MPIEAEKIQDMVYAHDKHIDSLAVSIETLASAVGATNKKVDEMIDIMSHQRVLTTRMDNLDENLKESFGRVNKRLAKSEEHQDDMVSGTMLRWIGAILISYTIMFGIYVVDTLHGLDRLATEKIHMQRGINKSDNRRIERLEELIDTAVHAKYLVETGKE